MYMILIYMQHQRESTFLPFYSAPLGCSPSASEPYLRLKHIVQRSGPTPSPALPMEGQS